MYAVKTSVYYDKEISFMKMYKRIVESITQATQHQLEQKLDNHI